MQSIKILSRDFIPLTDTTDYLSMIFTKSWHGVGDFELVIHREAHGADLIHKGCLVALSKDKVGIVRHREIQLDQNGKATENWLFKGATLKGLASQRVTVPPSHTAYDRRTDNAETVMRHYVNRNIVNPVHSRRRMSEVILASNQNRGVNVAWQTRYKKLDEELELISLLSGLGWDFILDTDNNRFRFEILQGRDLSVNQTENSPVFFSPEYGNVQSQSFTDSDLNMRNVGYIAGQGEGAERLIVELGEDEGLDRHETFVDARDVGGEDEGGQEMTEEEERQFLTDRGQQKMNELRNEMFLEAEIMSPISRTTYENEFESFVSHVQPSFRQTRKTEMFGPFIYERDYKLGDIVTVMNKKWGFMVDQRITEVTEIHEPTGFKLEAIFGQKRPTIIDKVISEFKQYENELKR